MPRAGLPASTIASGWSTVSTDGSVNTDTTGSVGDRPEHQVTYRQTSSVGDRPEHGDKQTGSVGDRPEYGDVQTCSVADRPEHGTTDGSVGRPVLSTDDSARRPA